MTIPNNGIGIFKIPDSDIVSTLFSLFALQIERYFPRNLGGGIKWK